MRLVILDPVEDRDLDGIYDYIAANNPPAAYRVLLELREAFLFLRDNPFGGQVRPELRSDLRAFPVRSYLVLYRLTEDTVEIVYVAHGRRDLAALVALDRR